MWYGVVSTNFFYTNFQIYGNFWQGSCIDLHAINGVDHTCTWLDDGICLKIRQNMNIIHVFLYGRLKISIEHVMVLFSDPITNF